MLIDLPMFHARKQGLASERWDAFVDAAERLDWTAYLALAMEAGVFSPTRKPDNLEEVLKAGGSFTSAVYDEYDAIGYVLHTGPDPESTLESLAVAYGKSFFDKLRQEVLDRSRFYSHSRAWNDDLPGILLSFGPLDVLYCSGRMAVAGNMQAMRGLLDSGLDPAGCDESGLPLVLVALTKERMYSMEQKMQVAHMLMGAGAKIQETFPPPKDVDGPRSLLELGLLYLIHDMKGPLPMTNYVDFSFPWAYFEDSGIGIKEILPPEGDVEGHRRILAAVGRAVVMDDRFMEGLIKDDPDMPKALASASSFDYLPPYVQQDWLKSALELCELRISGCKPGKVATKKHSI